MSKGIAIETILYLLVGIIVVGIVIYLVYTYAIGAPIGEQECRSMAISWCTSCKNANGGDWTQAAGPTPSTDLQACATKYFSTIPGAACQNNGPWCSTFIPA